MVTVEDEPDLSSMLRAGVDLDDDGDFDPTKLLSQPINFTESIDVLDIHIDEDSEDNAYLEPMPNVGDSAISDGERNNEIYYDQNSKSNNEEDDHRQKYFRAPSPDHHRQQRGRYNHGQNEGVADMNNGSMYSRNRNINSRGRSSSEHRRNRVSGVKHQEVGRNTVRIAEVQQKIRQVQQQIHENMDGDHHAGRGMLGDNQHSYRQEPGYSHHQDQEQMYSDNYPDETYHNGDPRDRFSPPRDSSHHESHRSYNGMPRSMRGGPDRYEGNRTEVHQRRSHQQPLHQQHQHREQPIMSHSQRGMDSHNTPRGNAHDNRYGPQDRHHPMRRNQPYELRPQIDNNGQDGFRDGPGAMHQQHVLGGMSQSLNGLGSHGNNVSNNIDNPMTRQMSQSFNRGMPNMNMNASSNGNMPRRGIQSMSDSLNGMSNQPIMDPSNNGIDSSTNGMNRSRNGIDGSIDRGIQSMSASINGMQNMNSNIMMARQHQNQQRGIQSMSASLNGMQQMNAEQNMSQSTNGMQGVYGSQQPGGPEPMVMPINRSMNGMQNMQHNHDGGNFRHQQSQNGMPNHPLQGMSQSLNGAPSALYGMYGDHEIQIGNNNISMMNRSNNMGNGMNSSMNNDLNGSKNGGPMLNNSTVPSASLLNQVSNLANLPNRGGGAINTDMMQQLQGGGIDPTKMTKFMEAMKRTASSRKLIRDLNIGAMLRGDLKSPASSNKNKSVVKAKRKSGRQGYTKTQSVAAASREFLKAQRQEAAV